MIGGDKMYTLTTKNITEMETEAIIFPLFANGNDDSFIQLDEKFQGELSNLKEAGDISNKYGKIAKFPTFNKIKSKRMYFVGLGAEKDMTKNSLRKAFGKLFKQLSKDEITDAALFAANLSRLSLDKEQIFEAIGEAHTLAPFVFSTYHTNKKEQDGVMTKLTIVGMEEKMEEIVINSLKTGSALGEGANIARHLVNIPGNYLTATDLAEFAKGLAKNHGFEIEILDKEEMKRLNMGALLAVNRGSEEPPKLIVLRYQGKETWENPLTLVGKGITFDTGGYSLKGKDNIVGMKTDMGGAAAVLGAMDAIGTLKPKVNVMAVIAATDNMISGNALKPDDVIVSMSGKTIEVRNTDAEGRLVLADAITYAKKEGAAKIIDVATLTGGVIVALGNEVTGAMTNDEKWFEEVKHAADETGEYIWQLPYFDHFKEQVRNSHIADLNNSPGRAGHAILAGSFLGEFVEETPWVHLDIAGTATTDRDYELGPKGATGVMARTLAKVVVNAEE